jgi:hypothetical protein
MSSGNGRVLGNDLTWEQGDAHHGSRWRSGFGVGFGGCRFGFGACLAASARFFSTAAGQGSRARGEAHGEVQQTAQESEQAEDPQAKL